MSNDLSLVIDGEAHKGWTRVRISMSIESLANGFSIGYTERAGESRKIVEGSPCTLKTANEDVIDGYVDESNESYDAASHNLDVSGRTRPGDLVDCSAIFKSGQWLNRTAIQIADDLCSPFKIGVTSDVDTGGKISRFTLEDGETVHEALVRLARMRGLLVMSDVGRNVVFTRTGKVKVPNTLEYGVNIKAGRRNGSLKDRYSRYVVKGQGPGTDDLSGRTLVTPAYSVTDDSVTRYRPLVVQAEDAGTKADLEKRARWERSTRLGKSQRLSYTFPQSWNHDGGLWRPNVLVDVVDTFMNILDTLLVVSVTLADDERGVRTELELVSPAAFDVLDLPAPKGKKALF